MCRSYWLPRCLLETRVVLHRPDSSIKVPNPGRSVSSARAIYKHRIIKIRHYTSFQGYPKFRSRNRIGYGWSVHQKGKCPGCPAPVTIGLLPFILTLFKLLKIIKTVAILRYNARTGLWGVLPWLLMYVSIRHTSMQNVCLLYQDKVWNTNTHICAAQSIERAKIMRCLSCRYPQ